MRLSDAIQQLSAKTATLPDIAIQALASLPLAKEHLDKYDQAILQGEHEKAEEYAYCFWKEIDKRLG